MDVVEHSVGTSRSPIVFRILWHDKKRKCCEFVIEKRWSIVGKLHLILAAIAIGVAVVISDENKAGVAVIVTAVAILLVLLTRLHYQVKKESLLVIASVGLQFTSTFASGREECAFFENSNLHDCIICEGFTMHSVIYYLAITLKDKRSQKVVQIVPLFQSSLPRLKCLRLIYTILKEDLWNRPAFNG